MYSTYLLYQFLDLNLFMYSTYLLYLSDLSAVQAKPVGTSKLLL